MNGEDSVGKMYANSDNSKACFQSLVGSQDVVIFPQRQSATFPFRIVVLAWNISVSFVCSQSVEKRS